MICLFPDGGPLTVPIPKGEMNVIRAVLEDDHDFIPELIERKKEETSMKATKALPIVIAHKSALIESSLPNKIAKGRTKR